jgi:hypothetical protein
MNMLEVSYLSRLVSNLTVKFVRQQREKSPIENDIPHKAITFVRSENAPADQGGRCPMAGTDMFHSTGELRQIIRVGANGHEKCNGVF